MTMSEAGTGTVVPIGSSLREARRRRGLDLAEVEAATLIRARYLEALEQDRFDLLPLGSYRRTFLREYAEFLGLGGEAYLEEFDRRLRAAKPEPPTPPPRRRFPVGRPPELPLAGIAVVGVIVVLIGVAFWQLNGSGQPRVVGTPPAPARTNRLAPARAHHPRLTPARSPRRAPPVVLTLKATHGSCWMLVRIGSSSGHILYEQTLKPGQTVRFALRKPLWLRLGAPQNVSAMIAGRATTTTLGSQTGNLLATRSGFRPTA